MNNESANESLEAKARAMNKEMEAAREIPLSYGLVAYVDAEDFERINKYKWYAHRRPGYPADRCHVAETYVTQPDGKRRMILMHRMVMGEPEGFTVDHKDHDLLNCRRANLRIATRQENAQNRSIAKRNSSGYKGVWRDRTRQKYRVRIQCNGVRYNLGPFDNAEEAAKAYDEAARRLHGEFAFTNERDLAKGTL